MVEVECTNCHAKILKPACWVKRTKRHFCSKACHDAKQQVTIIKRCEICSDLFAVRPCDWLKYTTCHNSSCRAHKKQNSKNGMWKGGVAKERSCSSQTSAYKKWRKAVFERDNYTCQFCGKRGGELNADHIKPYAFFEDLRLELSNGRTLCVTCHKTTYKAACAYRDKKHNVGGSDGKTSS